MTHPLEETIVLPFPVYSRLARQYSEMQTKKTETSLPRADEVRKEIEAIIAEAKAAGLGFDNASVAASPKAAELRKRLDVLVPEAQALTAAAESGMVMTRHLTARVKEGVEKGLQTIEVPVGEAMVLTGIGEPALR